MFISADELVSRLRRALLFGYRRAAVGVPGHGLVAGFDRAVVFDIDTGFARNFAIAAAHGRERQQRDAHHGCQSVRLHKITSLFSGRPVPVGRSLLGGDQTQHDAHWIAWQRTQQYNSATRPPLGSWHYLHRAIRPKDLPNLPGFSSPPALLETAARAALLSAALLGIAHFRSAAHAGFIRMNLLP